MKQILLFSIVIFVSSFGVLVASQTVYAACGGSYTCISYDPRTMVCGPGTDSPTSCSGGSPSACSADFGSACGACGVAGGQSCSFQCSLSACGANGCQASQIYVDYGSGGSTSCPNNGSGCYSSPSCSNPTPAPTPAPTPTPAPGCTGCSDNGNCSNTCTTDACGWDSCGNGCRFGSKNCSVLPTPTPTPTPPTCAQECGAGYIATCSSFTASCSHVLPGGTVTDPNQCVNRVSGTTYAGSTTSDCTSSQTCTCYTATAINCGYPITCTASCECPTGNIQARAHFVGPASNMLCSVIPNASPLGDTVFSFIAPGSYTSPPPQTQPAGTSYVTWQSMPAGPADYTIQALPPSTAYGGPQYCPTIGTIGSADSSPLPNYATQPLGEQQILTYDVGFSESQNWFQARGGSVHSNSSISVSLPKDNDSQDFIVPETGGNKGGIITYNSNGSASFGSINTSATNQGFLIPDASPYSYPISYYSYYSDRFPSKTVTNNSAEPASSGVYLWQYNNIDMSIVSSWDIEAGKSVIVFVPSNLNINSSITVQEGGFLAFIVSGNINVSVNLGNASGSNTLTPNRVTGAHVSGIYITDGTFSSGSSSKQLVGAGTFVANTFSLGRDLGINNFTYPGELFVYRPDLWRNAPEELKEIKIKWEEVAP